MPHEYQKYAIEYIKSHPVTALFLDMGLGKTVTTLTAIRDLMYDTFEVQRVLVVAPLRVARDTWPDEIKKWDHLKCLSCSVVVGSVAERRRALQQDADIYIVNRENLAWLYENSCLDFDMVVLDELSSFKNRQSKRFASQGETHHRAHRYTQRQWVDGSLGRVPHPGYGKAAGGIYQPVPEPVLPAG